mgnify:FL=1
MHRSTWKQFEARVACTFGSTRAPLSGGNGKVTRSDSFHKKLFIECKHGIKSAFWTLYNATKPKAQKEEKVPVLCLGSKNQEGFLICFHVHDAGKVFLSWLEAQSYMDIPTAYAILKEAQKKIDRAS